MTEQQRPVNVRGETVLEEAQRVVEGPRRVTYRHPYDDHTALGLAWTGILSKHLGVPIAIIPAHVVSMMMVAVKVIREVGVHHRDNLVDIGGYAYCADIEIEEHERRRAPAENVAIPNFPPYGSDLENGYVWIGILSSDNGFDVDRVLMHAYKVGDGVTVPPDSFSGIAECGAAYWTGAVVKGERCPACILEITGA